MGRRVMKQRRNMADLKVVDIAEYDLLVNLAVRIGIVSINERRE
jgi:hypothetical protein